MVSLSIRSAMRGSSSLTWMPGTLVLLVENSPRTASPAFGLGSQRSMWLGPPQLKMRMTDLALAFSLGGDESAADQPPHSAPAAAAAEVCRNVRRELGWCIASSPAGGQIAADPYRAADGFIVPEGGGRFQENLSRVVMPFPGIV